MVPLCQGGHLTVLLLLQMAMGSSPKTGGRREVPLRQVGEGMLPL